ncbi:hybrid sensor histidine kinase/response regulator [Poseidonocella sedimentorum]|uniref:histidine kinase n=1 Tax=Poseidonocella sedimentorum TaxID=871652 RepID=A0A1I6D9N5_9RHOB|nr:PAS domain-containing hybrid sensor histidine kinase/response regulator [Poseidonocella sedimentorum]SFR02153.1 PAS domain S-box-containing protein [Poseidonocella sedimentorum]
MRRSRLREILNGLEVPGRLKALTATRSGGVLLLGTVLLLVIGITLLSTHARNQIDNLTAANSGARQWSMAQAEVEFLNYQTALLTGISDETPDLRALRRAFDVFYNRIAIIASGRTFELLHEDPRSARDIANIERFIARTMPLIDGPDAALRAALPEMLVEARAIRPSVRELTVRSMTLYARSYDNGRARMAGNLSQIALLTGALVALLMAGLLALTALSRVAQIQAREITQASARITAIVKTSLDPIIVVGPDGRILEFNDSAEETFGYSRDEATGANLLSLLVPPHLREEYAAGIKRFLREGGEDLTDNGRIRIEGMRRDGSHFPVEVSLTSSQTADGQILITYVRDISARVAAERELMQARDRAVAGEQTKANLLAVMSHEMRTPLNGLLGTLDLLQRTALDPLQEDYVRIMTRSGGSLLHHVNDVLDVLKIDSERPEIESALFDPVPLIADVVEEQEETARARGNTIRQDLPDAGTLSVVGDEMRFRQVLQNLLSNAIKFTRNGEIALGTDFDPHRAEITVTVTDTGAGIDSENISRIFDDFVTLDPAYNRINEGTGLGLGIARRLVEAMNGSLGVESEPGEGSVFWFRLPALAQVTNEEVEGSEGADTRLDAAPTPLDVLVVEDNEINRFVVREMLKRLGHRVTEAKNGHEGIAWTKARRFDLILMDISMPVIDGVEATRHIRQGGGPNAHQPIIALTAHAMPEDFDRFREAGVSETVTKPIDLGALSALLGRIPQGGAGERDWPREDPRALLDLEVLEDLRRALGEANFTRMQSQFLRETEDALEAVQGSAEGTTAQDYASEVHRIAGSTAIFGARRLRELLIEHRQLVLDGGLDAACDQWLEIWAVWKDTRAGLTQEAPAVPVRISAS